MANSDITTVSGPENRLWRLISQRTLLDSSFLLFFLPSPIHFPLPPSPSSPPFSPLPFHTLPFLPNPLSTPPSIPIPFPSLLPLPPLSSRFSPPLTITLVPFPPFPIPHSLPSIPSLLSFLVPFILSHPLNPSPSALLHSFPPPKTPFPFHLCPSLPFPSLYFPPNALSMATSEL